MRAPASVLLVGLLAACRSPAPSGSTAPDASASAGPVTSCAHRTVIRPRIFGRFTGDSTSGLAGTQLVIGVDTTIPIAGVAASLILAEPRFAAEYAPSDLCSDDGSTADRIAVRCITEPSAKTSRVVIERDGTSLAVTQDGVRRLWAAPAQYGADGCFELRGLEAKQDLEPLRKTWMLDEPKCPRSPSSAPVKVTLKLAPPAVPMPCEPGSSQQASAQVTLLGAGKPRDLGALTNMCGPSWFRRAPDMNGIAVAASDMGSEQRFAYQLGDRVYFATDDGRVRSADLPCGARARFEVATAGRLQVPELPH